MYSQIADNKRKSFVLLAGFMLLVGFLAWLFGKFWGDYSVTVAILFGSAVYAVISYYGAAKAAVLLNGAREITREQDMRYYRIVENLAITNGLPMPKLYIMDDPAPNAFATGRDPTHSLVCVTSGLLNMMDDNELQGVLAHELGHVKNYDIRVSMVAFALSAVVTLLADIMLRMTFMNRGRRRNAEGDGALIMYGFAIFAAIVAPIAATLIKLAISRKREYMADATGALTTRYPQGLASALQKIAEFGGPLRKQNTATAHLFFTNPLSSHSLLNIFSTHPPIDERIKRLVAMEDQL